MTPENFPTLDERCRRIREIDMVFEELFREHQALYRRGLNRRLQRRLREMVWSDGKTHWKF